MTGKKDSTVRFTNKQKKKLAKFASQLDEKDLAQATTPSPIAVGGMQEIGYKTLPRDVIENYLLLHPTVPRGAEMKANRIIRRGYTISKGDEKARKYCHKILVDSGDLTTIKKWVKDTYGFGGGYLSLVSNRAKDAILYLTMEHPVYFGIAKYPDNYSNKALAGKYKIDPKTKKAAFYSQYHKVHGEWKQFGQQILAEKVAHLKFDTWGDEPEGISLIQYLYLVIKYLLNIEDAAAQNMYRHGQTQKKLTTKVTSEKRLKEIAKNVSEMNAKDVIILPEGTDVANLTPGQTQFVEYHDAFQTLLAIRLGIPKPLLTMDGTNTNKATLDEQKKDIVADYFADELVIQQTIEDEIFKPACELKFGKGFTDIPNFTFNKLEEDKDAVAARMFQVAQASQMFATAINQLKETDPGGETVDLLLDSLKNYVNELKVYPADEGDAIVVRK